LHHLVAPPALGVGDSANLVTITRGGKPVAELRPLGQAKLSAQALIERWRHLPALDPVTVRADIDQTLDSSVR
jgi:antitoxin (DNA-binding transcriptional repressor) of toxin-antitoxin stability system